MTNEKYRPDIDGLRAIAILSVLAFHFFPQYFHSGFIGVDIFFVISGYLITNNIYDDIHKKSFSVFLFYERRIKRIFPLLILLFICCYLFGIFYLNYFDFSNLSKHIIYGVIFSSNLLLWSQAGYFSDNATYLPLLHLWSLGVEEQLYIVLPFVFIFFFKFKRSIIGGISFLFVISFFLNLFLTYESSSAAFYFPFSRAWEIFAGCWVALILKYGWATRFLTRKSSDLISILGVFFILAGFFVITEKNKFPGFYALFPVLGAAFLIMSGRDAFFNKLFLSKPIMVFVGLLSFSLYVWHWPIIVFFELIFPDLKNEYYQIIPFGITLVIGVLSHFFFENPLRSTKKRWVTFVLLFSWVGIFFLALATYKYGFLTKNDEVIKKISEYKYDYVLGYREGTCFLKPDQDFKKFQNCDIPQNNGKPVIFIWGDSHAAHLYSGYKHKYENKYQIVQMTASGCPPILGLPIVDREYCLSINNHIYERIIALKPEKIVLAAAWSRYGGKSISPTLDKLNGYDVDVIGPVPEWKGSLPRQLLSYYKDYKNIPLRMNFGLDMEGKKYEEIVENSVKKFSNVRYISPISIFCTKDGCLTYIEGLPFEPTAWDYGHLTKSGAEFLVTNFPD